MDLIKLFAPDAVDLLWAHVFPGTGLRAMNASFVGETLFQLNPGVWPRRRPDAQLLSARTPAG